MRQAVPIITRQPEVDEAPAEQAQSYFARYTKSSAELRQVVATALEETADWRTSAQYINQEVDKALKQPLQIIADGKGIGRLPVNIATYADATFVVADEPTVTEGTVLRNAKFGYEVGGSYRHVSRVDFLVMDSDGRVLEVGCKNSEALETFQDNLFGRSFSPQELKELYAVNAAVIIEAQRRSSDKLEAFIADRGWGENGLAWAKEAKLAYFDPKDFDILKWAAEVNIPPERLYQAGFVERQVNKKGELTYSNRREEVVYIPFLNEQHDIVSWRMRLFHPQPGSPKYRGAPLDRAYRIDNGVFDQLYASRLLKDIAGKPLIITEGEFKCLVNTQMTGIATLGITGITLVTDEIIQAIIAAKPSEVVIIFDRDPEGAGYSRLDTLTDSQRQAYLIAKRFEYEGFDKVSVGTLPNVYDLVTRKMEEGGVETEQTRKILDRHGIVDGDKVGLDDLALVLKEIFGPEAAKEQIESIVASAPDLRQLERSNQIDIPLHELYLRRQALKTGLRDFSRHVARSEKFSSNSPSFQPAEAFIQKLSKQVESIENAFRALLATDYGAKRVAQPPMEHFTLFATSQVPDANHKYLVCASGKIIPATELREDVIQLVIAPEDSPERPRVERIKELIVPVSMQKLTSVYYKKSKLPDGYLNYFIAGRKAFGGPPVIPDLPVRRQTANYHEFARTVMAGYLTQKYPLSDYSFETDVRFQQLNPTHWAHHAQADFLILKDGEAPRAVVSCPIWEHKSKSGNQHRVLSEHASTRTAIKNFLRNPKLETQLDKFQVIATKLKTFESDQSWSIAIEALEKLGVNEAALRNAGAISLSAQNMDELKHSLQSDGLLNQAIQAGLFVPDKDYFVRPRFVGPVVYLPRLNHAGQVAGFSIIPLSAADRREGVEGLLPSFAFELSNSRAHTAAFDTRDSLLFQRELGKGPGKTVIVVEGEIEALQIKSILADLQRRDIVVVGHTDFMGLSTAQLQRIKNSQARSIIFIGQAAQFNSSK
ncbi:MAG: hypothetical protein KDD62_05780, partial [Bdellovibrionales bacterium]|nr:hypothetical protein [Bdellovibrionales bacterium]